MCAYQTRLGEQQLDSCLAGSSPAGWTHLIEDLGDGRVVPGSHSVLAQRLLNELQHRVLRTTTHQLREQSSSTSASADVTLEMQLKGSMSNISKGSTDIKWN